MVIRPYVTSFSSQGFDGDVTPLMGTVSLISFLSLVLGDLSAYLKMFGDSVSS